MAGVFVVYILVLLIMKKIYFVFVLLLSFVLLGGCEKHWKIHNQLSSIVYTLSGDEKLFSLSFSNRIKWTINKGPLLMSWSYWIDPTYLKLWKFEKYYDSGLDNKKVVYYDEYSWRRAGLIVYILREILHKKNVALYIPTYKKLHFCETCKSLDLKGDFKINFSWWYIWTWKYLVVYNPNLIKFDTGDLLLYSCDIWTMKEDGFYQNSTGVNINNFYWSKIIDINWKQKSREKIDLLLKPLNLAKYKRVFVYYPKYRYRSGILALYLQENYK